ncbi:MAG: hypothetical protein WC988_04475 [Patescibacteria group bacterium]
MTSTPLELAEFKNPVLLSGLEYYHGRFFTHSEVAKKLADKNPQLVTVLIENLRPEHYYKNAYGKRSLLERPTLFRELVFDDFFKEYGDSKGNQIYAEWLKKYENNDEEIFNKELRPRYEQQILSKRKDHDKLFKPRRRLVWDRYYNLPEPLDRVDWRNPYDNIFIWTEGKHRYCTRGGSGSSGGRETNSIMGFGFAQMNMSREIPTTILIYSKDNKLLFGANFDSLTLPAYDLGSNYFLDREEEERLKKSINLYRWDRIYDKLTLEI